MLQVVNVGRTASGVKNAELHVIIHVAMIDVRGIVREIGLRCWHWRRGQRCEIIGRGWVASRLARRRRTVNPLGDRAERGSSFCSSRCLSGVSTIALVAFCGTIHHHGRISHRPGAQEKFLEL